MTRRTFLTGLACGPVGVRAPVRAAILIRLSGGLSHLDSFDPKPRAPRPIRGPFEAIPTAVAGMQFSEHLPRLAERARRLTVVRSLCSRETNHERAANLMELTDAVPGARKIAFSEGRLHEALAEARRAVERGSRLVIVEPRGPVYDTHAAAFSALARRLLPELDFALAALLDELDERGLLQETLVVATGEFGRSPRINPQGGRDHHAAAWSAVLAGGGLTGGRLLGATDGWGARVTDRPVRPQDLARTVLAALGRQPTPGSAPERGRVIAEVLA
ncbi:MAG: DUF1501 domain-containing protein [Bryobacterales bacterium]|nr:DUF1501 domain-containing protein [Bryobacteraceae bacterium]MDW8129875.1 DUF1501 domain-containing protein [Bryobacterales bacterium]